MLQAVRRFLVLSGLLCSLGQSALAGSAQGFKPESVRCLLTVEVLEVLVQPTQQLMGQVKVLTIDAPSSPSCRSEFPRGTELWADISNRSIIEAYVPTNGTQLKLRFTYQLDQKGRATRQYQRVFE